MARSSLSNMFQKTNEVHEHRTKQAKHDFLPPKPKTNYLKKAFSYRGAVAWNNLPSEIKNSETVNIFKAKLKIIIWDFTLILLVFVTFKYMYAE